MEEQKGIAWVSLLCMWNIAIIMLLWINISAIYYFVEESLYVWSAD